MQQQTQQQGRAWEKISVGDVVDVVHKIDELKQEYSLAYELGLFAFHNMFWIAPTVMGVFSCCCCIYRTGRTACCNPIVLFLYAMMALFLMVVYVGVFSSFSVPS